MINITGDEKKSHKGFFIALSFFVGLVLLDANSTDATAKESIHGFKHRSLTLKCRLVNIIILSLMMSSIIVLSMM